MVVFVPDRGEYTIVPSPVLVSDTKEMKSTEWILSYSSEKPATFSTVISKAPTEKASPVLSIFSNTWESKGQVAGKAASQVAPIMNGCLLAAMTEKGSL